MKVNVVLTGVFMVMLAGMIYMRANAWDDFFICPPGVIPECPFPGGEFSVFFPHEYDCEWFFHCHNGVAYCKKCPAGLHWNKWLDTCDYPSRARCEECVPAHPIEVCDLYGFGSVMHGYAKAKVWY